MGLSRRAVEPGATGRRSLRSLTVVVALCALLVSACDWSFQTLDGAGGGNGRTTNDVGSWNSAIVINGKPHVFYYDADDRRLRHAWWNGVHWTFRDLDGPGVPGGNGRSGNRVGQMSSVILYNGVPHVFYFDSSGGNLRHAYLVGFTWYFETLDGAGGGNGRTSDVVGNYTSALLYNGRPHVFYYNQDAGDLRHGYWNGQLWAFETLDGAGGANGRVFVDVGRFSDTTLYNGRPHVFYYNDTKQSLRHAYFTGAGWGFETLDGEVGGPHGRTNNAVGQWASAMLFRGRPHAFYYDSTDSALRHTYWNGQYWASETLDGTGGPNGRVNSAVGQDVSVMLYGSLPQVFYSDQTGGTLRRAHYDGVSWNFEALDGNGVPGGNGRTVNNVGFFTAAVQVGFEIQVFYQDWTADVLRRARYS